MRKIFILLALAFCASSVAFSQGIPCPCDDVAEYGSGPMGMVSPGDTLVLIANNGTGHHDPDAYCTGSWTSDHALYIPWSGQVQMVYDAPITVNFLYPDCRTRLATGSKCATQSGSIEWYQSGPKAIYITTSSNLTVSFHQSGSGGSIETVYDTLTPPSCP